MSGDPALAARWLTLTRETLPALAAPRRWPVRHDHCFQRILLDNACGGVWYDHIRDRPAYAHAAPDLLARAIALGEAAVAGEADLDALNARSLRWRAARSENAVRRVDGSDAFRPVRRASPD